MTVGMFRFAQCNGCERRGRLPCIVQNSLIVRKGHVTNLAQPALNKRNRQVSLDIIEALHKLIPYRLIQVEPSAPRPHDPPPKPVSAEKCGHVQHIPPDSSAVGERGQVSHVARQRSQVPGVVGDALKLQGDSSNQIPRVKLEVFDFFRFRMTTCGFRSIFPVIPGFSQDFVDMEQRETLFVISAEIRFKMVASR